MSNSIPKCTSKESEMYLKSENMASVVGSETNKLFKVLFNSHFTNYQKTIPEKIEGSDFVFLCFMFFVSLNSL